MIEVRNLTKYYGTHLALDNLSFTINEGEVLGFLGPNGAGKSTTMKIITCFLSATEGTVLVDGLDVFDNSLEVRKLIGYLPEHPPLYLDMTVRDYLRFTAAIKGVAAAKVNMMVDNVVEKCSLTKYYNARCRALSKGYRQRVGIAQAMVHEPKYLILDEPTIGLDPIQIVEIRNLIKSFGQDHTVILSTHILPEVDMTCERVIIISDGKVVAEDTTANLRSSIHQSRELAVTFRGGSSDIAARLGDIEGVTAVAIDAGPDGASTATLAIDPGSDVRSDVARSIVSANLDLLEMRHVAMTLEEIFVKVTMK